MREIGGRLGTSGKVLVGSPRMGLIHIGCAGGPEMTSGSIYT
jgi:hypothetical protein